jgi:hypothetical protein
VAFASEFGHLAAWSLQNADGGVDVYGRYVLPGQDLAAGDEFALDSSAHEQKHPAVACALLRNCLVVYEDDWPDGGDTDIRGVFVRPHRVFVPLNLRNRP